MLPVVSHVTVEEFWLTNVCRTILTQRHLWGFKHELLISSHNISIEIISGL
jgi:hypothetical protein